MIEKQGVGHGACTMAVSHRICPRLTLSAKSRHAEIWETILAGSQLAVGNAWVSAYVPVEAYHLNHQSTAGIASESP